MKYVNIKSLTQGTVVRDVSYENCRIVETKHAPNLSYDFHAHAENTVTFILQGSFREEFYGKEFECNQFDLLYKPAYTVHRNNYYKYGTHSLLIEFFEEIDAVGNYKQSGSFISSNQKEFAQNIALKLYSLLEAQNNLASFTADELALEFAKPDTNIENERRPPLWLAKTKEYLEANIFENITLSALSNLANVHPVYYARCFRKFTRYSVSQYIHKKRISAAIEKLTNHNNSISEIANDFGYTDQSHFTHFFKRETGFTPHAFRSRFQSYK